MSVHIAPARTHNLTVSLTCTHTAATVPATNRYEPAAPLGHDHAAELVAEAQRLGWALRGGPASARIGTLIARDADGVPLAEWLVPNEHAFRWLAAQAGLVAARAAAGRPDPQAPREGRTVTAVARRPGRPRITSPANLLDAARTVEAEHGFAGITVAAVTATEGVKYSTFYRSYRSLDALLVDLVDAVLDDVTWPADGLAWRPHLEQLADALSGAVAGHVGLAVQLDRMSSLPHPLRVQHQRARDVLVAAGLDADDAAGAADALIVAATVHPARATRHLPALVLDGLALRIGGQR